jgi:hypothetical protein
MTHKALSHRYLFLFGPEVGDFFQGTAFPRSCNKAPNLRKVLGISHATRTIVNKAPPLKSQKVPSNRRYLCMMGKDWVSPKSHQPERGCGD